MTGWKTIIFNIVTILGMIAAMLGVDVPTELQGENIQVGLDHLWKGLAFVLAIGNLVLRYFTKTPVFKKE